MGSFGGFYKGDKKKAKKEKEVKSEGIGNAPVITMPEIIIKKKKDY